MQEISCGCPCGRRHLDRLPPGPAHARVATAELDGPRSRAAPHAHEGCRPHHFPHLPPPQRALLACFAILARDVRRYGGGNLGLLRGLLLLAGMSNELRRAAREPHILNHRLLAQAQAQASYGLLVSYWTLTRRLQITIELINHTDCRTQVIKKRFRGTHTSAARPEPLSQADPGGCPPQRTPQRQPCASCPSSSSRQPWPTTRSGTGLGSAARRA